MHNYKEIGLKNSWEKKSCDLVISCQYQEEIDTLNQVARHRPRSSLVLGIQQENRQIRQLQLENKGRHLFFVVTEISINGGGDLCLILFF